MKIKNLKNNPEQDRIKTIRLTEEEIGSHKKDFIEFENKNIPLYMKRLSIFTIGILPYFIYQDSFVNLIPPESIYIRVIPIAIALIALFSVFSPLKKRAGYLRMIYICLLFSGMAMMACLLAMTITSAVYERYLLGTIVIVFCIYASSLLGLKYMIPIYAVPFLALTAFLLSREAVPVNKILLLSEPLAIALLCIILGELTRRLRFRVYLESKTVAAQNDQLQKELSLARAIQSSLIPMTLPRIDELDISTFYAPMIAIGGDFYDFISFKEQHLFGVFISDVSGHGVSAALITSMVKTLINTADRIKESPAALMQYINEKLVGQTNNNFVTAFYGIFDLKQKTLKYARAGHNAPFLIRSDVLTEISGKGTLLGLFENLSFEEKEIALETKDKVFLYTDGLIEAENPEGYEFGNVLVSDILVTCSRNSCKQCFKEICGGLSEFRGTDNFDDDITFIIIEVK